MEASTRVSKSDILSLRDQIDELESDIWSIDGQIQDLEEDRDKLYATQSTLEKKLDELEAAEESLGPCPRCHNTRKVWELDSIGWDLIDCPECVGGDE